MKARKHNLSAKVPHTENSTVLAILPNRNDFETLREILDGGGWTLRNASSCDEAVRLVRSETPAVVTCDHQLPDGSWRDLFKLLAALENPPPMVVVSRNADESLWAEVLNLGGYDVLAKPFERSEVSRVMEMALRHGRAPVITYL
jgi:DNA-binding response OmpR family regulator